MQSGTSPRPLRQAGPALWRPQRLPRVTAARRADAGKPKETPDETRSRPLPHGRPRCRSRVRRGRRLQGGPPLRSGLDRHHLDQRHREHAPDRPRLRARGQDPLGADRLPGDEGRRDRRLPRQLDAGPAAFPRRPRRRQGRRRHRQESRRCQVHPRRADQGRDRARRRRLQGSRPPTATTSAKRSTESRAVHPPTRTCRR